jgi:ArsR family transcriptional regulator
VAELTEVLGVGQPTVSRHLRRLADVGLVTARRTGTWAFYSLRAQANGDFTARLLTLLRDVLTEGADEDEAAVAAVLDRRRRTTSEFFRATARDWDRVRERLLGPQRHVRRLREIVGEGGTIVDLGTGTGLLLETLAPAADCLIGIDASQEMLDVARRRVRDHELPNTELRLGALEHLPLGDGEADLMVANMVLHHVADVPTVLREIRRGLASAGRLLIADLEEHDEESFWRDLGAQWPGFHPKELRGWLEAAGYESVRREELSPADEESARPAVILTEARRRD